MSRAQLLRQLASEIETLEAMQTYVERIDMSADLEFMIDWRVGSSIDGYQQLRKAMAMQLQAVLPLAANQAVQAQRELVQDLAQRLGITEWQP